MVAKKSPLARILMAGLVVVAVSAGVTWAQAPHAHGEHEGHAPGAAKPVLDHGKKWKTDAPLRQGMEAIRAEVVAALPAIHEKRYTPPEYAALAGKIGAQLSSIVANCKLPKDADAQLHLVLAELVAGTQAMQAQSGQREGAIRVLGALGTYGSYFEHAGWKPIRH
jgi:hypothetical protein